MLEAGVPVLSIQPSATARCSSAEIVHLDLHPVRQALQHGLVPLVYGDVAFDDTQGCTIVSTEEIFSYLARQLHPMRVILVGKVNGVYDRDPLLDPSARAVPRITPQTFPQIASGLGSGHGVDVTGGMGSKVSDMVALVAQGHTQSVHLISGLLPGALTRALLGAKQPEGTVIEG
jgi:isopentenyl phosphate kinase